MWNCDKNNNGGSFAEGESYTGNSNPTYSPHDQFSTGGRMDETKKDATPKLNSFIPSDVYSDFNAEYLDKDVCRLWILRTMHGHNKPTCPKCRAILEGIRLQRFWEGKRVKCKECKKFFTATTGTFVGGSHLDCRQIILMAILINFKVPARDIARILCIDPETVRLWKHKYQAIELMRRGETIPLRQIETTTGDQFPRDNC